MKLIPYLAFCASVILFHRLTGREMHIVTRVFVVYAPMALAALTAFLIFSAAKEGIADARLPPEIEALCEQMEPGSTADEFLAAAALIEDHELRDGRYVDEEWRNTVRRVIVDVRHTAGLVQCTAHFDADDILVGRRYRLVEPT